MNKLYIVVILFIFCVPLGISAQQSRNDYYLPENIFRFAESLFQEGDYLRAAGEFQRYLHSFELVPEAADSIYFKIGLCYKLGKDFERSIRYLEKTIQFRPQGPYLYDSYYQTGHVFFLMKDYKKSLDYITEKASLVPRGDIQRNMRLLAGLNLLYQRQWKAAEDYLNAANTEIRNNVLEQSLIGFAKEGQKLPLKSQALAGLLSAVVPGSGKIYGRRTMDGLVSLFIVGTNAWQAYEGFHKDGIRSTKGWICATLSAFFYVGDIYGSMVAVRLYNQQLENTLLGRVGVTVDVYLK